MSLTKARLSVIDSNVVNVIDFLSSTERAEVTSGAVPTTDITGKIDLAIAHVASLGGGKLIFPPGKYKGRLRISTSNIEVTGYGAEVGFQDVDATLQVYAPDPGNSIPFNYSFVGGINAGVPNNVSPNATFYDIDTVTRGDDTITLLGSSTGLVSGDWCMLMSGHNSASSINNHIPQTHQLVKVRSVSGLSVVLEQTPDASFNSLSVDPYLVKFPFLENVTVRGFTFNNIAGGGAAYLYATCTTNGLVMEDVVLNPQTSTGVFATVRNATFSNVSIVGGKGGFSNGRMCDNINIDNCKASIVSSGPFIEHYFYFSEENVKKLSINNCRGVNGGVIISMGTGYTDVSISNSIFDCYSGDINAIGIATCPNSFFTISNSIFNCVDGQQGSPWPAAKPSVGVSIYSPGSKVSFVNCVLTQFGTGSCWVSDFGSSLPAFSNTHANDTINDYAPYTNLSTTTTSGESLQSIYKLNDGGKIEFTPFDAVITFGLGDPNGVVTANPGSIYMNRAGGAGVSIYVKESGFGTNTGWVGK